MALFLLQYVPVEFLHETRYQHMLRSKISVCIVFGLNFRAINEEIDTVEEIKLSVYHTAPPCTYAKTFDEI